MIILQQLNIENLHLHQTPSRGDKFANKYQFKGLKWPTGHTFGHPCFGVSDTCEVILDGCREQEVGDMFVLHITESTCQMVLIILLLFLFKDTSVQQPLQPSLQTVAPVYFCGRGAHACPKGISSEGVCVRSCAALFLPAVLHRVLMQLIQFLQSFVMIQA